MAWWEGIVNSISFIDAEFYITEVIPALNEGVVMSVKLIIPSAIFGLLLGVGIGVLRVFGSPFWRWFGNTYTALFRGVPLIVQLFMIYYALPQLGRFLQKLGASYFPSIPMPSLNIDPYQAAVTGFILCGAAYHSEYIRGALLSIKTGQFKAAQALGMTRFQTIRRIFIPQALRLALPSYGNEIIYLIKYSSLAMVVTCYELTGQAKLLVHDTFRSTEVYVLLAVYYLVLVTIATWILSKIDKYCSVPGLGRQQKT